LAERARAALRPAASLRGSEGVVFFVRFALVLALAFVPVAGSLTTPYGFGSFAVHVYLLVAVAFVYACGLFYMYAHDLLPAYRRLFAVAADLILVTLWIATGRGEASAQLMPLYYLEVLVAAVWYGLVGGLVAATGAVCLFLVIVVPVSNPMLRLQYVMFTHLVPYVYLTALLAGLLAHMEMLGRQRLEEQRLVMQQFRQEIDAATRIHQQSLPAALPRVPGFQIGDASRIAGRTAGLYGGDVYSVRRLESEPAGQRSFRYEVFVADVAGKTFMAVVNVPVLIRTLEICLEPDSCEHTMRRSNELLYQFYKPASFASVFYAHLESDLRLLTYVNAGSVPPLLVRAAGGDAIPLEPTGPALGALPSAEFTEQCLDLGPGDVLVIYTDGVTSARNAQGEEFAEERVAELARSSRHLNAQHIADRLLDAVSDFQGKGGHRPDDLSILVLKAEETEEPQAPTPAP
jgi:serine phosphatase RsbU (regulator of sigma subunit)